MADHTDVPGMDPRTDITDLFIFQKPRSLTRSILILNVNPFAPTQASTFDPEASYEFKIDTNADAQAEIAFHILFAWSGDGRQTASVYRAADAAARGAGPVGDVVVHAAPVSFDSGVPVTTEGAYRFYAGLRSDPWFADVEGILNNFQVTGQDFFAGKNVFGIVLEVPNSALGPNSQIGVWARTMIPVHGALSQVDQMGRPLINALFNPAEEDRRIFNHTPPAQQRAIFLPKFVASLQAFGYAEVEATRVATQLLPDILPYEYAVAPGYPNGRQLTDDMLDIMLTLATNGEVTTDRVGPHTDILDDFPYLGPPHPVEMP
jgi:hypothetical protein